MIIAPVDSNSAATASQASKFASAPLNAIHSKEIKNG